MGLSYQKMAQLELATALTAARAERSYRGQCQALSWVARFAKDQKNVRKTAEAAVDAAAREDDLYKAVFPLAWPIRALLERGEQKAAAEQLDRALRKSDAVTPAASQSEAVFLLFQAALHGPDRLWVTPFDKLALISLHDRNWRLRRNMRDAALMVASVDHSRAKAFVNSVEDEKLKAELWARLDSKKYLQPRPFFW